MLTVAAVIENAGLREGRPGGTNTNLFAFAIFANNFDITIAIKGIDTIVDSINTIVIALAIFAIAIAINFASAILIFDLSISSW